MRTLMNRKYFAKSLAGFFSASLLALISSCDIGLGPAVDLSAPEIEITSHKDNDSVGSIFAIRGKASDNEGVTKITIDFNDADIHYQVVPGGEWQKKTSLNGSWISVANNPNYYCNVNGNSIEWSIGVDSSEKCASKTDNSYTVEANASDNAGNSGRKSKSICTLTIDENNPIVSIYKPELEPGKQTDVETFRAGCQLKDGNTISRLLNGTLVLQGRQSQALAFKALRIEFDDGKLQSGDAKYTSGTAVDSMDQLLALPQARLGDTPDPTVYYSKTLSGGDLREWSLTVKPEEWVNEENHLDTGSHVIRVVSTSLSTSNAWERKVLGYFVWYPEADKPWVNASTGKLTEAEEPVDCYPGSSISGSAQDDDGIKSIVSKVSKKGDDGNYVLYSENGYESTVTHTLPQKDAKYSAWSIKVPSVNGNYEYEITVTDINGSTYSEKRYFKTSDVSAPKIELTSPLDNTSAILDANGNLSFDVTASDDGKIALFAFVWLNPALRADTNNKIKYLTGTDPEWDNADKDGYVDANGNIIYRLDDKLGKNKYEFKNRVFNLYNQDKKLGFNIGGVDKKGNRIPLCTQDFIFLASDGSKKTVKAISLTGDNITPEEFTITSIKIGDVTKDFTNGVPVFPSSCNGKTATITGTWKDKLTSELDNKTKVHKPVVSWGTSTTASSSSFKEDGTWTATIIAPSGGGTITAKLTDFGGNTKVIQEAASIESTESGLSRIDSRSEDKAYKNTDTIKITLEFTKNVEVSTTNGTPQLKLNNGGIATYVSGSGSTSHLFEYTVGSETDTDNLYVTEIKQNGAKWSEKGSGEDITAKVTIPDDNTALKNNLKATRKIRIDNTPPKVKEIKCISASVKANETVNFAKDATLLFMLEFTEPVKITGASSLNMQFKHKRSGVEVKTDTSTESGTKYVIMSYTVAQGDNASTLTFDKLNAQGVTVADEAGNALVDFNDFTKPVFTGFVIDTTAPAAPSFGSWEPGDLVTADTGTSFTLTGIETGATAEYSLDGANWLPYDGEVKITNNGNYDVTARQTDKAGNTSSETAHKLFAVNKGALLKRITADSRSGVYTDSKTATKTIINGKIEFRTAVKIAKNATVTVNVKNGANTSKTISLEECKASAGESDVFTFKYEVANGDSIANDGKLEVTGWSFSKVNLNGTDVNVTFPTAGNGLLFSENRDIRILTGSPAMDGNATFTGEGADAVLVVPFNREIEKGIGEIVFEYDVSIAGNEFHVPAVLTAEEYGELSSNSTIKAAYEVGMNGAKKQGSKLVSETATKYILDYDKDDTDTAVVNAFKALNKHKITIPIISDNVKVTGSDKKTLTIELKETYKLPVKGAKYKVSIPADAVYDGIQNGNAAFDLTVTAAGIEAPQIRMRKPSYTISGAGTTPTANAVMSSAQTATMRIDCRTPGATIMYAVNERAQNAVIVSASDTDYTSNIRKELVDAEIPTAFDKNVADAADPKAIPLGGSNAVSNFNAQGLKIAIAAQSSKGANTKETSYEYANRTVLKLQITGGYSDDGKSSTVSKIKEGANNLTFGQLKVWVMGGDKPSGGNSLDPFPLSWGDSKNFKLMQKDSTNTYQAQGMGSTWHWVTWDLTDVAYHGFVIGDVPSDALSEGPTVWYAAECGWVPEKSYYPLYPGATLTMSVGDGINPSFFFRLKNIGERK